LCIKLDSFDAMLSEFAFWIDSQYRIRLGPYTADRKARPVLRFTSMSIILPVWFEYSSTSALDLPARSTAPALKEVASTGTNIFGLPAHPWAGAAGQHMVPTASNTLKSLG